MTCAWHHKCCLINDEKFLVLILKIKGTLYIYLKKILLQITLLSDSTDIGFSVCPIMCCWSLSPGFQSFSSPESCIYFLGVLNIHILELIKIDTCLHFHITLVITLRYIIILTIPENSADPKSWISIPTFWLFTSLVISYQTTVVFML